MKHITTATTAKQPTVNFNQEFACCTVTCYQTHSAFCYTETKLKAYKAQRVISKANKHQTYVTPLIAKLLLSNNMYRATYFYWIR